MIDLLYIYITTRKEWNCKTKKEKKPCKTEKRKRLKCTKGTNYTLRLKQKKVYVYSLLFNINSLNLLPSSSVALSIFATQRHPRSNSSSSPTVVDHQSRALNSDMVLLCYAKSEICKTSVDYEQKSTNNLFQMMSIIKLLFKRPGSNKQTNTSNNYDPFFWQGNQVYYQNSNVFYS